MALARGIHEPCLLDVDVQFVDSVIDPNRHICLPSSQFRGMTLAVSGGIKNDICIITRVETWLKNFRTAKILDSF